MSSFDDVRAVYERLGAEEPFWAVLSHDCYKQSVVDQEAFFATGREQVERQLRAIAEAGVMPGRGRALDFGCGVGRLTNALALHFDEVVGVDVSSTMVDNARKLARGPRCRFVVNAKDDLSVFPDHHFDFVYSDITLQHIPRPASTNYLREFLRIVKPDGLVVCMIADGKHLAEGSLAAWANRVYRERVRPLFKRVRGKYPVQIHLLSRQQVEEAAAERGASIYRVDGLQQRRREKRLVYWLTPRGWNGAAKAA